MRMRYRVLLALALLLAGLLAAGQAYTAADIPIAFTSDTAGKGAAIERVSLHTKGSRYYLLLPSGWDKAALRVVLEAGKTYYADTGEGDPVALTNGTVTDAFAGAEPVRLLDGDRRYIAKVLVMQGSLPALFVNTESGSVKAIHSSKEHRETGELRFIGEKGELLCEDALREIRLRGNTTKNYPKKPYQIKLEHKAELIPDAGTARTWVLLADHLDLALMRNRITLDMAQYVGMRFAVSTRSVDLYINGRYSGVYTLAEKVQVNKSRVDITERDDEMLMLNGGQDLLSYKFFIDDINKNAQFAGFEIPNSPADVTGGYLLQLDKRYRVVAEREHGYIVTDSGLGLVIESPEVASRAQIEYIGQYVNAFDRAIRAKDGCDPETGKHYAELADVDSFALKCLLEDVSANFDIKAGSQFFYKDTDEKGGKLCAGPGWDYDLTFGSGEKMAASMSFLGTSKASGSWYNALFTKQPEFRKRVNELYQQYYLPALQVLAGERAPTPGMALRSVNEYEAEIAASAEMNFIRNPISNIKGYNTTSGTSHDKSVSRLITFIEKRAVALAEFYAKKAE